jgi:hypothetical protein
MARIFHANVDHVADLECQVLYEQVIGHERVFTELNLDCDTVLYKIGLVVRENRTLSSGLNLFLLFRGRKFHRLFDERRISRHPLRRALFFLAPATKLAPMHLFMAMGE